MVIIAPQTKVCGVFCCPDLCTDYASPPLLTPTNGALKAASRFACVRTPEKITRRYYQTRRIREWFQLDPRPAHSGWENYLWQPAGRDAGPFLPYRQNP